MTSSKNHSAGFVALVNDAKTRIRELGVDGYKGMLAAKEPHLLVDVREQSEWADGHAAGAMHLGKGVIERDIETAVPDKNIPLILYCGGGYRSALAADALQRMGYSNVFSLEGGWRAYLASGLPVDK